MKKSSLVLIFFICFLPFLAFGQDSVSDPEKYSPVDQFQFKSFSFTGKVDRTTTEIVLKPVSIVEAQNVKRPAPGVSASWKARSGSTLHNTTAIASAEVKGLWQYTNPNLGHRTFLVQCNDKILRADNDIPSSGGNEFGTELYNLNSGSSAAFCGHVNDDWIGAATGTTPFGYSGGSDYAREVLAFHEYNSSTTNYVDGTLEVSNDEKDRNLLIVENTTATHWLYFAHQRRLNGVYLDFLTGATNSVDSGVSIQTIRGGVWTDVDNIVDGTRDPANSKCFYESGHITWDYDTDDDPYVVPGTSSHYYWYRTGVTADITDGCKIYQLRVDDNCEAITSLWDGLWTLASSAVLSSDTGFQNYSGEIQNGNEVYYMDLTGLESDKAVYVGFLNPVFNIQLKIDPDYVNNESGTLTGISVWNTDNDWGDIESFTDGTSNGAISLSTSGTIQWDGTNIKEAKRFMVGEDLIPLYWYRLSWNDTLPSDSIRVWEINGGMKPNKLPHYDGMIGHNGRAWAWPGYYYKHGLDFAMEGKPWVWTGQLAGSTGNMFGPGIPNAASPLTSYLIISTISPARLYMLQGKVPGRFDELCLSYDHGAIAPHSMLTIEDAVKLFSKNQIVNAVVFMDKDGFYMTDGRKPLSFSQPIADLFNTGTTPYIEPTYMHISDGWIDYDEKSVHWSVPLNMENSDTIQTTCNYELVYSYLNDEWWGWHKRNTSVSRGTSLSASNNQRIIYAGDYGGKVWRLGTGDNDNGNSIDHWIETSQIPFYGLNYKFRVLNIRTMHKAQSSGNIDVTIFPDDKIEGVSPSGVTNISMVNSGYGQAFGKVTYNEVGESCGFKFRSGATEIETMELEAITVDIQKDIRTDGP